MRIRLQPTADRVQHLMQKYEACRDSDDMLIATVWKDEVLKYNEGGSGISTAINMLESISKGMFTNTESIRRCRQKIEETCPELRGKTYEHRQGNQANVLGELKEIGGKFELAQAKAVADKYVNLLREHCHRIEIAGSIRRGVQMVGDIEIVCIPKSFNRGMFSDGFGEVVEKLEKIKGDSDGKHTCRMTPEGIKLDIFMATDENWALTFLIRTGPAEWVRNILAQFNKIGYKSEGSIPVHQSTRERLLLLGEVAIFNKLGIPFVKPENRI